MNDGGTVQVTRRSLLMRHHRPTAKLAIETLPEVLTEEVECKWVDAGIAEAEHSGDQSNDHVAKGGVNLVIVKGPVQVQHMGGQPTHSKKPNEDQDNFGQTLSSFHLEGQK